VEGNVPGGTMALRATFTLDAAGLVAGLTITA
jgi:hypothetical protein